MGTGIAADTFTSRDSLARMQVSRLDRSVHKPRHSKYGSDRSKASSRGSGDTSYSSYPAGDSDGS